MMRRGPTFPSITRAVPRHMLAHESPVPSAPKLEAELHRIEIPQGAVDQDSQEQGPTSVIQRSAHGAQHNPSVFLFEGQLCTIIRVLRSRQTTNYIARIDSDWQLTDVRKLYATLQGSQHLARRAALPIFIQLEDLRPFVWHDELWATCATHDGKLEPTIIQQALIKIDGSRISEIHIQPSPRHEKNWLPCVSGAASGDELKLVYSVSPLVVLTARRTADPARCSVEPTASEVPQGLGHLRGGSQLVPYGDGWLAVVHEVHKPRRVPPNCNPLMSDFWPPVIVDPVAPGEPTVYLHRFARFSRDLSRVELGEPFRFWHTGIEFCAGLAPWPSDPSKYVLSFGVADREAWLAVVTREVIATHVGA